MVDDLDTKPCLVESRQGFSVLYKNRLLYSKYNPSQSINKIIQEIEIKPNTLYLCISPVLGYGLQELIKKITDNSYIFAIECDKDLYEISDTFLSPILQNQEKKITYSLIKNQNDLACLFDKIQLGNFKRVKPIDFSAAAQINNDFYKNCIKIADNYISNFWKNRITLVKMGRLFAKNIFLNLSKISKSKKLKRNSIGSPILIFGAGTTVDETILKIKDQADNFFILCVDVALSTLLKNGIIPDAIVTVESQLAIEKAFVGLNKINIPLIADITSRPNVSKILNGDTYFFLSEYSNTNFLNRLINQNIVSLSIPPLGSVGLVAIEIALYLRQPNTPIFFTGLDFSFYPGKTHCKEAPAHRNALDNHNKLKSIENVDAAFINGSFYCRCKDGAEMITNPAMAGYASLFSARYSMKEGITDISSGGMDIGSRFCTPEQMLQIASEYHKTQATNFEETECSISSGKIKTFCQNELESLKNIRNILTQGNNNKKELQKLLDEREYLFLHFPDAQLGLKMELSFLKRIRAEINFFIKYIEITLRSF